MKSCAPPKGGAKKKPEDPRAPKRPPPAFFLVCLKNRPEIRGECPELCRGEARRGGSHTAAGDRQPVKGRLRRRRTVGRRRRPTAVQESLALQRGGR